MLSVVNVTNKESYKFLIARGIYKESIVGLRDYWKIGTNTISSRCSKWNVVRRGLKMVSVASSAGRARVSSVYVSKLFMLRTSRSLSCHSIWLGLQ